MTSSWPAQIFINDEKWQINTNIDTATVEVQFQVITADPQSEWVVWLGWVIRGGDTGIRMIPKHPSEYSKYPDGFGLGLRFLLCSSRSFGFPALFWIIRIRTWNINERLWFLAFFMSFFFRYVQHCVWAITLSMQQMMQERKGKSYWPDGIITRLEQKVMWWRLKHIFESINFMFAWIYIVGKI